MRPKNVVSTKLALYSHDLSSVLIMHYPVRGLNGLPGGHVEAKENPDEAIRRELMEELTLTVSTLKRADFFLRQGNAGPIILAYTAIAPEDVSIVPTRPSFEYGKWVSKDELPGIVMSPEYTRFVLQNWPKP
jgi:8-oxo-dGTP pyrophosphatase MutT (NUDIX family)